MIEKKYDVSFEIAGPAAIFSRPDTGSSPISYPAPTHSALKSMVEVLAYSTEAYFAPLMVEICSPIVYHNYTTNYGGPLKKSGTPNFQLHATVLENVCYKIYGYIGSYNPPTHRSNPQHKLQEVFMRRLQAGQFHSTPFLGWKEFTPSYFGPLRDSTSVETSINLTIPSMLFSMYDRPTNGRILPLFRQEVKIIQGVIYYAE
jgi:CRISPR-associated protein Cas5d